MRTATLLLLSICFAMPATAMAQLTLGSTTTIFRESGGPLEMTVITPSASASVNIDDRVKINADWEADVVSGASVSIVDAPTAGVDVISTATVLDDTRHTFAGGLEVASDFATLRGRVGYGFESDYRSLSFDVGGRVELFERNTTFDVAYLRGFDKSCTFFQPRAQEAVDRRPMESSDGCFQGIERISEDIDLQTFQGSWTQAWTPTFATQVSTTAQLVHGFQGNPYRAVWLGRSAALENHPQNRARYAVGLSARYWIKPIDGAVQVFARAYRDTWDIESITAELAYEQVLEGGLRLRARGRYYSQSAASFYSDDYTRFPRGQYFTGDRELSAMKTLTLGGRVQWSVPPNDDGSVIGFLSAFDLVLKADWISYTFNDFHYGTTEVPVPGALIVTFGLEATF